MNLDLNFANIILKSQPFTSRQALGRQIHRKYVNPDIIQECLNTLDIFRVLLEGMPHQKNRVIRDVSKTINVIVLKEEQVIYQEGEKATQIYFVLNGVVSSCITNVKEQQEETIIERKEIDSFEKGTGFGEGEFVSESKRKLTTIAKENETVVGKLQVSSFEEVLENYRMRVYFRKRDFFQQCPLFNGLNPTKLDFIVNNAKPMTYKISQKLIREGQKAKTLLLINKGEISLYRKKKQKNIKVYSSNLKLKNLQNEKRIMIGTLQEGNFIGDLEFALKLKHKYNAVCSTETAEVYYCDYRIILTQMTDEELKEIEKYYSERDEYYNDKLKKFYEASQMIENRKRQFLPPLTLDQINLKRKLMHRHVEKVPSLIGHSTPLDIYKMIQRKQARVKKQPEEKKKYPQIQLLDNHYQKKKHQSSNKGSPLPELVTPKKKRFLTEPNIDSSATRDYLNEEKLDKVHSSLMINSKIEKQNSLSMIKEGKKKKFEMVGKELKKMKPQSENYQLKEIIQKIKSSKKET